VHFLRYLYIINIHKFRSFLIAQSRPSLPNQPAGIKRRLHHRVFEHGSFITYQTCIRCRNECSRTSSFPTTTVYALLLSAMCAASHSKFTLVYLITVMAFLSRILRQNIVWQQTVTSNMR